MASQLHSRSQGTTSRWGRPALLRTTLALALALLAVPVTSSSIAYAGEPGVCDTNKGTGKIDAFLQNTEPDGSGEWANGNMNATKADLVEGDFVPQRVDLSLLASGENELAFNYDVWVKDHGNTIKWAYDYLANQRMTNGVTITNWNVEDEDGPTATVHVTFDVPAGVKETRLYYDAHIASELDHGAGSGAGSINGSPYHGGLVTLNCAKSGANANQIAASAIDAGELTIVKDATPADGTDFHFAITPGGASSTFSLDDDSDTTLPDRLTYRVAPGTYTVEELDIPAGWNLTGLSCSKTPSSSGPTSRSIAIADDEKVTCTFVNSKVSYGDLRVTNTATPAYVRDYDWTVDKSLVGPATRRIAEGQSATVDYEVEVTPSAPKDSAFTVSGRIEVTNPNAVPIADVTVTAAIPGATCTVLDGGTPVSGPVPIPAGTTSYSYTCTLGAGTGSTTRGSSSASLSWSADANYGTSGVATTSTGFDFAAATPAVTDASVTVTDSDYDLAAGTGGNVVRATDGARTFSYRLTWPGEPGACATYDNTATITEKDGDSWSDGARVEVCEGKDLTVTKTVVHGYYRTYDWALTKEVVGPSTKEAGPDGTAKFDYKVTATGGKASDSSWAMSGAIKVSNPNAWPVTLTGISDQVDVGGGASCVVTQGADLVVPADGSRTFDYRCMFTGQPEYDGTNTATATWDGAEHVSPHTSASGTADVVADRWERATVDSTVTVVDDKTDPAHPVTLGTATWSGEGVATEFTYTGPALLGSEGDCVDYTNNAWIEELPAKRASADVTVCSPDDITVSATAAASYATTYLWDITKDVDRTRAEVEPGATAGFDYTVVARPSGSEDSGWDLRGTITLTNPNTYEDVTVTLSDAYDGGGVCTPDSTTVVVPRASKALVGYSCTFATEPDYSGTGTVTASWQGGGTEARVPVSFERVGETDREVAVYDDRTDPAATPTLLGTAVWDAPVAERSFEYHLDLPATPGGCRDHTNTAWLDLTANDVLLPGGALLPALDRFARQTVTVCERPDVAVTADAEATYDTTYLWDISKEADRTWAEVGPGRTARFGYVVLAKPDGSRDEGWSLSGTITLTNPRTSDVTVTLSDAYDGGGVCAPDSTTVVVPKAGTAEVGYACTFASRPTYSGTHTVTASFGGRTTTATVPVSFERVGETDREVAVYDDRTDPAGTPTLLGTAVWDAPALERRFEYDLDLGALPGQCADHPNTAWVDVSHGPDPSAQEMVTVCERGALSVIKDAEASYDRTYLWDIDKSVTPEVAEIPAGAKQDFRYDVTAVPAGYRDSGWELTGTITVSNPDVNNSVEAWLEDVYDNGTADPSDDVTCTVTYPDGLDHLVLPRATGSGDAVTAGTASATYDCAFTTAPSYSGKNHVTVTWGDGESASYAKPVLFEEDLSVDRTVTVYDDKVDLETPVALGQATWAWDDRSDAPVPTALPAYTLTESGVAGECTDYTNTAYIEVTDPTAYNPRASATATLCVEAALEVTKTVRASFDRSHHWLIDKAVARASSPGSDDGRATFDYTVTATPNGSTDSGYAMDGTVTVTNPNTYAGGSITATVADLPSVGGGATCTLTGGGTVTLAPEESRTLDYTCTFTGRPDPTGSNKARVTWAGPDERERSSSSGQQPVDFVLDDESDLTVTVTDDMTDPSVLGTAQWNAAGTPTEFTYSLEHEAGKNTCVDYTNTATIVQTGQSDSASVTVCGRGSLVVTTTASASFDRTYEWDVTKVADRTRIERPAGGHGTVHYTVGVTPDGFADSGWEMSGAVTVSNPHDHHGVTVHLTEVPDLGPGVRCAFGLATDPVVGAGETRTFPYTCTFDEKPAYSGTSTVRVDWGKGSVTATTDVAFELDDEVNRTVTVTDDHAEPGELGQVAWDSHGDTTEFEYAVVLEAPATACETVTNTATVVETGQSAQADVLVCASEVSDDDGGTKPPAPPAPPSPSPQPPVRPEPTKARPPAEVLPDTGAPAGGGAWTMLGGLMVALGLALLRRRRDLV